MSYDLIIKNGTVVDGTGAPRFHADIAVKDGLIADIGDVSAVVRWTVLSCALIFNAWIWGAAIDALRGRRVTGIGPFGVLEWTVLLTAVGIPLAVVAPGLTSARQKATAADCDNVYVALKREVAGEIDHLLNSTDTGTCDGTNTQDVIACVVARHQEATNPRNRAQPAYTSGEPDPCQVQVVALGHDAILFRQQAHRRFEPRTFRVQIEGREAPR